MATSLAICKIFEQVYKILLQDVSDFDASQPASFLQEPYVWVLYYVMTPSQAWLRWRRLQPWTLCHCMNLVWWHSIGVRQHPAHLWRAKRNKNQNATLRALPRNIATWIPQYYAVGVTTSSDSDPVILRDRGNAVCSDPVILRGSFTRKGACALVRAVRRWRAFIGTDLTIGARSIHKHCAFCLCACA